MKFILKINSLLLVILFFLSISAEGIKYHWKYEYKGRYESFESILINGINIYITERILFDNFNPKNTGLSDYIHKIGSEVFHKTECNFSSALIVATIYLNKYKTILAKRGAFVDKSKIHLLFAVALRLADKILTDVSVTDREFASVMGIRPREFKRLEREFLIEVDYSLHVSRETFDIAKKMILLNAEKGRHAQRHHSHIPPLKMAAMGH